MSVRWLGYGLDDRWFEFRQDKEILLSETVFFFFFFFSSYSSSSSSSSSSPSSSSPLPPSPRPPPFLLLLLLLLLVDVIHRLNSERSTTFRRPALLPSSGEMGRNVSTDGSLRKNYSQSAGLGVSSDFP